MSYLCTIPGLPRLYHIFALVNTQHTPQHSSLYSSRPLPNLQPQHPSLWDQTQAAGVGVQYATE